MASPIDVDGALRSRPAGLDDLPRFGCAADLGRSDRQAIRDVRDKAPPSYRPVGATRKIVPFASSLTRSAPSRATAMPAGRPQTLSLSSTNPVMKSS